VDGDDSASCALPGLPPQGTCIGTTTVVGGGRVLQPSFVSNSVSGASTGSTAGDSEGYRLESNDLANGDAGIELWDYALQGSSIHGNVTSGYAAGLRIDPPFGLIDAFTADVSYNDFGANQAPLDAKLVLYGPPPDDDVVGFAPYTLDTTLPHNWWGSAPCGFPSDAQGWPNTRDPFAAAAPIAQAWRNGQTDLVGVCARNRLGNRNRTRPLARFLG
jgi:hypothetical protein